MKTDHYLWNLWSEKKQYNVPRLKRYYRIRERNLLWLTALSRSFLETEDNPRILKTDLWNEGNRDHRFFAETKGCRFGIDLSGLVCRRAKAKHADRIAVAQASIEFLPFEKDSFDMVWDISTIDHFPYPQTIVEEYHRVLVPGGVLLLISENPFCVSYPVTKLQSVFGLHVPFKGFRPSHMTRACRRVGFDIIDQFKTNVHLPTFIVYPIEHMGKLEQINRGRSPLWNLCKKYFVVLGRKPRSR